MVISTLPQRENFRAGDMEQECAVGTGGVPKGAKTSEYYRVNNIPARMDNPDWFQGYGTKKQHPMYSTEANKYGGKPPSVHTMPTQFHARTQKFSKHLGACGMYRNHSLNTDLDRSNVPSGLPYSV